MLNKKFLSSNKLIAVLHTRYDQKITVICKFHELPPMFEFPKFPLYWYTCLSCLVQIDIVIVFIVYRLFVKNIFCVQSANTDFFSQVVNKPADCCNCIVFIMVVKFDHFLFCRCSQLSCQISIESVRKIFTFLTEHTYVNIIIICFLLNSN